MFRLGLDNDQRMNQTECFLAGATLPAILGDAGFIFDDGVKGVLPGPG